MVNRLEAFSYKSPSPERGATKHENHPHRSLPRRGGRNNGAESGRFYGIGGGIKGRGIFI
ncbi:MAG: hypothetical protein AUK25_05075 [Desulfobacteraceae bacterium CG2_30_51_40]|nr:MAG: hypothetical protein AUK25_05075 [Desulfobacteraceae bacterium CG2_30_51_40]